MTRPLWLRWLVALGSGLALAPGFAPHDVPLVAWLALAALLWAAHGVRCRAGFLAGFLHGAAFYSFSLPWIYTVMRVHGHLGPVAAAGVLALMVAVLSCFPALFVAAFAWVAGRNLGPALLVAPFSWVALEFARTHMPHVGFPWNLLGYAVADDLALVQIASFAGIWGVSFLVAAFNAVVAWALLTPSRRAWLAPAAAGAILLAAVWFGQSLVPAAEPRRTAHLVQPNFPQTTSYPADWWQKHQAALDELERVSIASGQKASGLVIWPETSAPFYLDDPGFVSRIARIAGSTGSPVLFGAVHWRRDPAAGPEPYNSAALADPSGSLVFRYDKIHLVPFGEYVPLRRWLTFAKKLTAEVSDFRPGRGYATGRLPGGSFGVFICYEAIFPGEVRRFVAGGAGLLVNLSNDGWFGRSAAPEQHLAMARVRAVENRRWLLRATNDGHTVAVDPYGRYRARLAPDVRAALEAPYDFRTDRTLYTRFGDWFAWLCVAVAAVGLVAGRRKKQRKQKSRG